MFSIQDKEYPLFHKLYSKKIKLNDIDQKILNEIRENGPIATHILARKLKIKTTQLRTSLQKLERNYKIIRAGITTDEKGRPAILWDTTEKFVPKHLLKSAEKISAEEALKKLIVKFLKINGPSTIDEICGWLGFPEEKIKPLLDKLEKETLIKQGIFTTTKIATQWILTEDLNQLLKQKT
ncbi:MAG: winged helix DNA-binding domain-containing protein [Candidatus Odinarchaeota archaeon]|nr:winged helix DNA-binding domain-containing protein [Candidatus Odinarchaeota archaeon]